MIVNQSSSSSASNNSSGSYQTKLGSTQGTSEFETFLKMLTTQIKNQDPLNPMEGTEFAVQLATFSGVEQQVQTNQLLASLINKKGYDGISATANLIGKEVCTTSPVWFDGESLSLQIDEMDMSGRAMLVVMDQKGNEVGRKDMSGLPAGEYSWSGEIESGRLPQGRYSFRMDVEKDGNTMSSQPVGAFSEVTGVRMDNGGTALVLRSDGLTDLDLVTGVRVL